MSPSPQRALLTVRVRYEQDVVFARQRARQLASYFGFDAQDQTRLSTAVSEIARNAFKYASGGEVRFSLVFEGEQSLRVDISDAGKGIPDLGRIFDGRYRSSTGLGVGILGARRLTSDFHIDTGPQGTRVSFGKPLPKPVTDAQVVSVLDALTKEAPSGPLEEVRQQNQELLATLAEVERQQRELTALNRELDETNRGVVALYGELEEKATSLQKATELKSRFLSNMSHEFRTPLNSIVSLARMLLQFTDGELTVEQQRQVGYIRSSADELCVLVNDLLDIATIEAGKTVLRLESFQPSEVVAALRGMFRALTIENPKVVLEFEDAEEGLPDIRSDRGKIAQVLRNLVSNALKFTAEGSVRVTTRRGPHDTVVFTVRDTGIGIAASNRERIFEEFVQIDSEIQRTVRGTGLGLPLSRRIAAFLGGSLTMESELGTGSVFTFVVPTTYQRGAVVAEPPHTAKETLHVSNVAEVLRKLAESQESLLAEKLQGLAKKSNSEKILIIDDNEIARYLLNDVLMDEGFATLEAPNGPLGLALAREAQPRAIFLDLDMPGMDGYEVLKRLRADEATKNIPVVVNTAELLGEAELKKITTKAVAIVMKDSEVRESTVVRVRRVLEGLRVPPPAQSAAERGLS